MDKLKDLYNRQLVQNYKDLGYISKTSELVDIFYDAETTRGRELGHKEDSTREIDSGFSFH